MKTVSEFSVIAVVFIFLATILLSSRFFYVMELKSYAKKLKQSLGVSVIELDYSFDQMVYFVSLPSNSPIIKNAKREDISIEYDYTSFFFPKLSGISIYIHNKREKEMLAYLSIKDFRLPKLDQMLEGGKLSEKEYLKVSMYKLIHENTMKEISEEVYKQIQVGRTG
jgi:hypothetical protein